jgi:alkylated DNA repair dioxygenase AlkB
MKISSVRRENESHRRRAFGWAELGASAVFIGQMNVSGTSKETKASRAASGTLIVMAGTMQQFWKHDVPKTLENVGEQINLTFRKTGN